MERPGGKGMNGGWGRAAVLAAIMLVACLALLLYIPNMLLGYLSLHLIPTARDLVMGAYFVISVILAAAVFLRLQRGSP
jgi:hypothetical protein